MSRDHKSVIGSSHYHILNFPGNVITPSLAIDLLTYQNHLTGWDALEAAWKKTGTGTGRRKRQEEADEEEEDEQEEEGGGDGERRRRKRKQQAPSASGGGDGDGLRVRYRPGDVHSIGIDSETRPIVGGLLLEIKTRKNEQHQKEVMKAAIIGIVDYETLFDHLSDFQVAPPDSEEDRIVPPAFTRGKCQDERRGFLYDGILTGARRQVRQPKTVQIVTATANADAAATISSDSSGINQGDAE